MKRPASQFYWSDWLRDPALRASSLAARGLWMDMLAMMHEGSPYGHLTVGSEIISDGKLARMAGESASKVRKLLAELESHGVFSRTPEGAIYSRRMVRDEHIRNVRAKSGKSGGNPALVDPPDLEKDLVKQNDNQILTPSSSSSSSSSELTDSFNSARDALRERLPEAYRPDFDAFLRATGGIDRQYSWVRSIEAALSGMHPVGAPVTPESIGYAIRQYSANGDRPVWIRFLGYLRNENAPKTEQKFVKTGSENRAVSDITKGEGLLLFGSLREKRKHFRGQDAAKGVYVIDRTEYESLPPSIRSAVDAIGGLHRIANAPDEQVSFLASQFAAMYQAALTKSGENAT